MNKKAETDIISGTVWKNMGIIEEKKQWGVKIRGSEKTEHIDHIPEHPVKEKRKVIKICIRS